MSYRDALTEQPASLLASIWHQLKITALPSPPGYPERRIYLVRGHYVMLDTDIAELFGTRTGLLNQTVSRNRGRFPDDFAFRLTSEETARLRALGAIKPAGHGGRRNLPRVFTDLGLVMLSAILKSPMAVKLNIEVVRTVNDASHTSDA